MSAKLESIEDPVVEKLIAIGKKIRDDATGCDVLETYVFLIETRKMPYDLYQKIFLLDQFELLQIIEQTRRLGSYQNRIQNTTLQIDLN